MKSRGMYETPGGTILYFAHRGIESITLDRGAAHLKDELMPKYAELIYNGFWFSPEREMLQALIDKSQEFVSGRVRLKLYKGSAAVVGRSSPYSLYDQDLVTFEEGAVAYDHRDAAGFIKLNALRLRTLGKRARKIAEKARSGARSRKRWTGRLIFRSFLILHIAGAAGAAAFASARTDEVRGIDARWPCKDLRVYEYPRPCLKAAVQAFRGCNIEGEALCVE